MKHFQKKISFLFSTKKIKVKLISRKNNVIQNARREIEMFSLETENYFDRMLAALPEMKEMFRKKIRYIFAHKQKR